MNITETQIEDFCRRLFMSLPDSISAQRSDLEVLVTILPKASTGRACAIKMLDALVSRERAQQEFIFTGGGK